MMLLDAIPSLPTTVDDDTFKLIIEVRESRDLSMIILDSRSFCGNSECTIGSSETQDRRMRVCLTM